MMLKVNTLRGRFLLTAILLMALVLPAVFNTQHTVYKASDKSESLIADYQQLQSTVNKIEQSLQNSESKIFHYSIQLRASDRMDVLLFLGNARQAAKKLRRHAVTQETPGLRKISIKLSERLTKLETEIHGLLRVLANVETRYPAAPILLENLQPINIEIGSALETAIDEGVGLEYDEQQVYITTLFRELRYTWAQQVSSVRVFVANRSGIFGEPEASMANNELNRQLYVEQISELIAELKIHDRNGLLGFQQSLALEYITDAAKQYEKDFNKAAAIYISDQWRADLPLLANNIRPIYKQLWTTIYEAQSALDGLLEGNVQGLLGVSDSLSDTILVFMIFVVLILLLGFLLMELMIRRPISEVTHALQAEGLGESYSPTISKFTTRETDVMITAFNDMKAQVRSRQTRLESILDNAGEGIITIDEDGVIETFNTAAQQLFGYSPEEALGKQVQDIIKLTETRIHGDFLEFCRSPYSQSYLNDTVVSAKHRDGSVFPLSLNVSEMIIEDNHLYIALVEDISERVALMENLRTMAEHDSLTGLYNREYFMTELDRITENIKRGNNNRFALLYIDLDNFKFVNDTLGHLAGDQVLIEVTSMLSRRHRKSDILARLGGDEFAILINGTNREQVVTAAESHRKLLADYQFKYDGKIVNIGCSIGVTLFGHEPLIKEDILIQADIACHVAKCAGRNRIHIYEADDKQNMAAMSEDMGWASRIKHAIDEDRFIIACQPIVNAKSLLVTRYEVLLRMKGHDGSVILPSGFLPSAERFGLMLNIDRWVVEHAIKHLCQRHKTEPAANYSINLSAKSLGDQNVFKAITTALEKYKVDAKAVTFEITESVAISNLPAAIEFLKRLRNLGCKTALDDFGVGYSSFAYLKDLPVDYVKIDGSFVRNVHRDMLQLTLVRSINDIAHALGKKTVAEYVDSEECLAQLQETGVDYLQGYYVGKPTITDNQQDSVEVRSRMHLIQA